MRDKSANKGSRDALKKLKKRLNSEEWEALSARMQADEEFRNTVETLCDHGDQLDQGSLAAILPAARSLAEGIINAAIGKKGRGMKRRGVITYDSSLLPAPEGIREATVSHRRLRVAADKGTLLISIYPETPKTHRLMGRLGEPAEVERVSVVLTQGNRTVTEPCSNRGVFEFKGVRTGKTRVVVRDGRRVITDFEIEV